MLNVSYKNKIGHYTVTRNTADGTRKFRIDICHANCLCAMMFFTEDTAQVNCFFTDIKHAKACIKNGVLEDADNFVFSAQQCDNEMWKLIRLLADNGKKITIK